MAQPFSLLLKPASCDCNLHCRYCFYLDKTTLFGKASHRMSDDTLEALTKGYLALAMPQHVFCWQGGEPTLLGLEFFQHARRLQQRHQRRNASILNTLQTNGTLLDEAWGRFLHDQHFLVGLSLDGPPEFHDAMRGAGSHAHVLRGLDLLRHHQVPHNILTVIHRDNAAHPEELYRYLTSQGIAFQQYIECADVDAGGEPYPYALRPGQWGEFLCRLFDAWYAHDVGKVSIRLFDAIITRLATGAVTLCAMNTACCDYLVVEHDGSVYPCDFQVSEATRLGNIRQHKFATLRNQAAYQCWSRQKAPTHASCHACRWLPLCYGDCPRQRNPQGLSRLCADWQLFFQHTIERFENLADQLAPLHGHCHLP